jgi:hypothetical protein
MPIFTVRRRVDAYVDYVTQVRARTAKKAAELASEDEGAFEWQKDGVCSFDARLFIALDDDGMELEATEIRHF